MQHNLSFEKYSGTKSQKMPKWAERHFLYENGVMNFLKRLKLCKIFFRKILIYPIHGNIYSKNFKMSKNLLCMKIVEN